MSQRSTIRYRGHAAILAPVLTLLCALSASAEEPKGIRLRWTGSTDPVANARQMIEWGSTRGDVEEQLGVRSDVYNPREFICTGNRTETQSCKLGNRGNGSWSADFGDDAPKTWETMLFFVDGRFFQYIVEVPPDRFDLVETALAKALGEPDKSESSTVQNRMGASFDQEVRIWEGKEVDVNLMKRATVTEGLLGVTFKPLAEEVPKKEAEAPF